MEMLDCGDHSCNFAQDKGGQRTNGGCRCLKAIPEELRSRINYTFHRLKSDHEALKMSLESIVRHEDKKQAEIAKLLLQNEEMKQALAAMITHPRLYPNAGDWRIEQAQKALKEPMTEKRVEPTQKTDEPGRCRLCNTMGDYVNGLCALCCAPGFRK